ncbi:Fic family protein [Actinoplanes solisilvae]|uniref:Fic family protein n=1 Tax=Actinoplanes solisilvae TaxID=2486853 RepID=UPI000FDC1B21|nr:Fic family protein [Actinoplanes solisilvae]
MRPPDWHEHPDDIPTIANNVALLDAKISGAKGAREPFSLELVRSWHAEIHRDCRHVPSPAYVGNFRGSEHPHLATCNVVFGPFLGTPPDRVGEALRGFSLSLTQRLARLDASMPTSADATPSRLNPALECTAQHYALWLRIHPFVDGNGRTARVLANWILTRYWQPLIFPGRPPVDRANLIAASAAAVDPSTDDSSALTRFMRRRLVEARRAAGS